eukprot:SAG31_NODE_39644_length_286_cov_1.561497_1_plen_53_part_01
MPIVPRYWVRTYGGTAVRTYLGVHGRTKFSTRTGTWVQLYLRGATRRPIGDDF